MDRPPFCGLLESGLGMCRLWLFVSPVLFVGSLLFAFNNLAGGLACAVAVVVTTLQAYVVSGVLRCMLWLVDSNIELHSRL